MLCLRMICTPILPPFISLIKILVVRLSMFHVSVSIHDVSDRFTSDHPVVYIGGFCYENVSWYCSSIPNKIRIGGGHPPVQDRKGMPYPRVNCLLLPVCLLSIRRLWLPRLKIPKLQDHVSEILKILIANVAHGHSAAQIGVTLRPIILVSGYSTTAV